jgi:hypothetical protein
MRIVPRRLILVLAAAFASGCGSEPEIRVNPWPKTLDGGWQLVTSEEAPPVGFTIGATNPVRKVVTATYGNGDARVAVQGLVMATEANAFEMLQQYRPPGAVTFQKKSLFVVCNSKTQTQQQLVEFSRRLDSAWLGSAP